MSDPVQLAIYNRLELIRRGIDLHQKNEIPQPSDLAMLLLFIEHEMKCINILVKGAL